MVTVDSPVILLSQSEPVSCSNCCFLTHIQVSQETGKMVWHSHLFKSFPQFVMIHTVKGFSVVNETEVDIFLKFPCFLNDPVNVGNLISGSFSFSKPNLGIWKFLQDFKYDLTSMGDECNCSMASTFFGTTLLGNWDEDWSFPILWPLLGLPDLLAYWIQYLDVVIL